MALAACDEPVGAPEAKDMGAAWRLCLRMSSCCCIPGYELNMAASDSSESGELSEPNVGGATVGAATLSTVASSPATVAVVAEESVKVAAVVVMPAMLGQTMYIQTRITLATKVVFMFNDGVAK